MGNTIYQTNRVIIEYFYPEKKKKVIFVGLDAAGKTTILYLLSQEFGLREPVTLPTIGFNIETFEIKDLAFTSWDIGGEDRIRPLWKYYLENADYLIFVIDSSDYERLNYAKDELFKILHEPSLEGIPILFFANKQDLPTALGVKEIAERLQLYKIPSSTSWHIQACSAILKEGINEGFDWISNDCSFNPDRFKKFKSARSSIY